MSRATKMAISTVRKGRDEVPAGAKPADVVNVRRRFLIGKRYLIHDRDRCSPTNFAGCPQLFAEQLLGILWARHHLRSARACRCASFGHDDLHGSASS